jgi:16S rRNA (adenine1518-N6/adenine1519-N6)-dimethyltransferase
VLEIGPGPGILTVDLAETAGRVVAVEIDEDMRAVLRYELSDFGNVEIVGGDILQESIAELIGVEKDAAGRLGGYKVVANLPYYISSAALRHILESRILPELAVVMLQREVGERILADPGDMSILSVAVQFYAIPTIITIVPPRAFYPPPKVESAVIRLDIRDEPPVELPPGGRDSFFRVVKAGFSQKRKQLKNSLGSGLGLKPAECALALEEADIDPTRRAQTLTLDEWAAIARELADEI